MKACNPTQSTRKGSEPRFRVGRGFGRLAWMSFWTLWLCGCFSRPSLVKQYFSFVIPQPSRLSPTGQPRVLGICRISVDAPFDSLPLIYRTGEFSYERDPYAELLVPPARDLLAPIRGYFRQNGSFTDVVDPGSALQPNTLVEITVTQLYGDFRHPSKASAVLAMRLAFFDVSDGTRGKVLLQRDYLRSIPLRARRAAALVAGWDRALEEIIAAASADLNRKPGDDG
jgi:ABC-type uncharacterized transport system auxiliary subunit